MFTPPPVGMVNGRRHTPPNPLSTGGRLAGTDFYYFSPPQASHPGLRPHRTLLPDLTNRPLVAREIIPTTLSESGMGFYGVLYPTEAALLGYEIYAVNGFNEATAGRIRSGRGSHKTDNNDEKSLVGRINYSPAIGVDVGGSFHWGAYDDAGDETLTILALDGSWNRGPFDVKGEFRDGVSRRH